MIKKIIAWDLGATKCTAGLLSVDTQSSKLACLKTHSLKLDATESLNDLITQFETALEMRMSQADAICIGAAGHFDGQTITHENPYPYPMRIKDVAEEQNWPAYTVIHDYASIVCSTFTSFMQEDNNIRYLNKGEFDPYGRRVAFGIGTGLGLKDGLLLSKGDFWLGHNEIGHIGITVPPQATQSDFLRHQFLINFFEYEYTSQPITFEKILSGNGLVRLYRFLHPEVKDITAEAIGQLLKEGKEHELLDILAWYLGLFVGMVQLTFMPSGGIYITGGVTLKHPAVFDHQAFQRGIQATPAYASQRKTYPLAVLLNEQAPLYGCAYYAAIRLLKQNVTSLKVAS